MKKLEKDLILKDLDYINNEYDIKLQKLNSIISLFMDEETDIAKETIENDIKNAEQEAENIQNSERVSEEQIDSSGSGDTMAEEPSLEDVINNDVSAEELKPDIKSLYRKIVMKTHPDKCKDSKNFDLYSDFYKRAIKAKDNIDEAEIIYIAYKLKLNDVYDISDEHFSSIKKKIKEKEALSSNLNYNSFWIWYHTDNPQLKRMMIEQINNMKKRK